MPLRLTRCWTLRRRARIERFVVIACLLVFNRTVFAQSARVAVIHSVQQDEQARRLLAEVLASGFDAINVPLSPGDIRSTAQIADSVQAASALRPRPGGDLEVVIIDSKSGALLQRFVVSPESSPMGLELRAVEDLRAKLVELSILPDPSPSEVIEAQSRRSTDASAVPKTERPPSHSADSAIRNPPASDNRRPGKKDPFKLWLQAAVGATGSSGGLSTGAISRLGVRVEPTSSWSVSGLVALPLSAQTVETARGAATVDSHVVAAMIAYVPLRSPKLALDVGLAGGAGVFTMHGVPALAGDQGRTRSLWAGVGFAEVALAWNAAEWLRLRASMQLGGVAPRPVVEFDGEAVAAWGRPFGVATIGIEFDPISAARGTR